MERKDIIDFIEKTSKAHIERCILQTAKTPEVVLIISNLSEKINEKIGESTWKTLCQKFIDPKIGKLPENKLSWENMYRTHFLLKYFDYSKLGKLFDSNWELLSRNKTITPEFIEYYINKLWNWGWEGKKGQPYYSLSNNPAITQEFVEKYINKPWFWGKWGLSKNPAITPEFVERHLDEDWEWGHGGLSSNPSITSGFVRKHLNKPWDWPSLSRWMVPDVKDIKYFISKEKEILWTIRKGLSHRGLSANPNIDTEFIKAFIDKPWDWRQIFSRSDLITPKFINEIIKEHRIWAYDSGFMKRLSSNPAITPEFVNKKSKWKWHWGKYGLSSNPSITPEFVEENLDKDWHWGEDGLSSNPAITPEFVERHLDKPWHWGKSGFSSIPALIPEFIERHLDKPWDWGGNEGLSSNPAITLEFVQRHLDENWDWDEHGLSSNPAITLEFVETFIDKSWEVVDLLVNISLKKYTNYIKKITEKYKKGKLPTKEVKLLKCIEESKLPAREHQKRIVRHLLNNRGLIVAHDVGSGKTLTAVITSKCLIDENPKTKVIVVTPKSLIENFKKELKAYGITQKFMERRYTFMTFDAFKTKYEKRGIKCDKNTFLIIDEAHNIRTKITKNVKGVVSGKKASTFLNCAKNVWKVLLLTASPVYNNPYDVANLVAIVKGEEPPSDYYFENKILKSPRLFKDYFMCMFSFFSVAKSEFFPTYKEIYVDIPMSMEYYKQYKDVELLQSARGSFNVSMFLTNIRQATLAFEPCDKCIWTIQHVKKWAKEGKKTLIYSAFITYGVNKIQELLKKEKIPYLEIRGSTSMKNRKEAVNIFNKSKKENVLFITKAGGEGLDLKGVQNVILLESMWNRQNEQQVIGRAIRYKSHEHLPPDQRHVNIYHLILVKPKSVSDKRKSADVILRNITAKKEKRIIKFMNRLKEVSIENMDC